jgi:hypothetical protein
MATPNYQYEPLTPPSSWSAEERRFVQRISDIFDDIYLKYGRLDSNHLAINAVKEKNIDPDTVQAIGDKMTFTSNAAIALLAAGIELRVPYGELETYLRLVPGVGVEVGETSSDYWAVIKPSSFDIVQRGVGTIASFAYNKLWTNAAEVDRYVKIGGATLEWSATTGFSLDV